MKFEKIKKIWSIYGKYIKITGTLILFYLLYLKIDVKESIILFDKINYWILVPLLLYPLGIWLSSIKWKIAIKDKNYSIMELGKIYWISNFFSNFLPSTIGGDTYKVSKLKKEFGVKKTIVSILLDRGSGAFTILLILSFLSVLIYNKTNNLYFGMIPLIILIFIALGIYSLNIIKIKFFQDLKILIYKNKKIFLKLILISIPFILLGAFSLWVYYMMYGYSLNFLYVLIFYCLIQFIGMLPISINGWGLREGSMVYLFGLLGVSPEISLSIGILSRLVMMLQTGVGGIFYLNDKN